MPLKLHQTSAEIYVPDQRPAEEALGCTTALGIGAHQDDLEFMALFPIHAGYKNPEEAFTGVTVTDGGGSARTGVYTSYSDDEMMKVRRQEQNKAAQLGRYAAMISLDYPSSMVKRREEAHLHQDLMSILEASKPKTVYTHNPADKHETHVAVAMHVIRAIRQLEPSMRPAKLLGCEVWRNLDWMLDPEKIVLDVSQGEMLGKALMDVFDSQIGGGKRYDLATLGRKRANATYLESHSVDRSSLAEYAMDLTPLIQDDSLDPAEYTLGFIERLKKDVADRVRRYL
jgi:LmbE family N-acetylglucosaminyl deacetylase